MCFIDGVRTADPEWFLTGSPFPALLSVHVVCAEVEERMECGNVATECLM